MIQSFFLNSAYFGHKTLIMLGATRVLLHACVVNSVLLGFSFSGRAESNASFTTLKMIASSLVASLIISLVSKLLKSSAPSLDLAKSKNKIYPENVKEEAGLVDNTTAQTTPEKPTISQFKPKKVASAETSERQASKESTSKDERNVTNLRKDSKLKSVLGWTILLLVSGLSAAYIVMVAKDKSTKKDFIEPTSYALAFLVDNLGFLPLLGLVQYILIKSKSTGKLANLLLNPDFKYLYQDSLNPAAN